MSNQRKRKIYFSELKAYCDKNNINRFSLHLDAVPEDCNAVLKYPVLIEGEYNQMYIQLPGTMILSCVYDGKQIHSVRFGGVKCLQIKYGTLPGGATLYITCGTRDLKQVCKYEIDLESTATGVSSKCILNTGA